MLNLLLPLSRLFFFNDTATTEIYTLSLHDALPISIVEDSRKDDFWGAKASDEGTLVGMNVLGRLLMELREDLRGTNGDRKSTRLNSSHLVISYAVFCLKKKKKIIQRTPTHTPKHSL